MLLSVFKDPHSYTGEDAIEISCHGSAFIVQKVLALLLDSGCRMAQPGEFTMRAFLNGKLDLSQAEGVGDLIAANSKASHRLAMDQMRGGFSKKIRGLRDQLMQFASLIELELDFSEEDVEFADRSALKNLLVEIDTEVKLLADSFADGNVLKSGIPVAIIGKPNVGKSTLLNAILNEEKAIVSDIPGTTRDAIEDTIVINGMAFRFIDTAVCVIREIRLRPSALNVHTKKSDWQRLSYIYSISTIRIAWRWKTAWRNLLGNWVKKTCRKSILYLIANKIDRLVRCRSILKIWWSLNVSSFQQSEKKISQ